MRSCRRSPGAWPARAGARAGGVDERLGAAGEPGVAARQVHAPALALAGRLERGGLAVAAGVYERDELVGGIDAWASDFPVLRSALKGSWLVPEARGRGLGKEADRRWSTCASRASDRAWCARWRIRRTRRRRVSAVRWATARTARQPSKGESVEVVRFKLTRERWHPREDIELTGLEGCADLFGL